MVESAKSFSVEGTVKHILAALMAVVSVSAWGQAYPTRPITMVVPAPAGGPTDIIGRQAAHVLTGQISYNVIVENRGGAGNTLGTDYVARAKPDGYTLVVGSP
ncbi:MAG: Bug family tripartite tricarboxylate transporter substrate binding protein, partial [Candidatus Methylumidiphilus sp.]